jgi:sodium-dependent dicarboxylate transporter 2/3/5
VTILLTELASNTATAIMFASRQVTIVEMAHAGIWMNLMGIVLISLAVSLWRLPLVWGLAP